MVQSLEEVLAGKFVFDFYWPLLPFALPAFTATKPDKKYGLLQSASALFFFVFSPPYFKFKAILSKEFCDL